MNKKKYKPCAKCRKCYYGNQIDIVIDHQKLYSCDYLLLTGRRRPCPAGPGCVAFSAKSKAARMKPEYAQLKMAKKKAGAGA